jgi:hypothetical protein
MRASPCGPSRRARALPRLLALLLLVPALASCQPPQIVVHAAFIGRALAFVAAEPGEGEGGFCWKEAAVVDDSLRPAWRFTAPGTGECRALLPLFYGRPPAGADPSPPARRLETGRLYIVEGDATAGISGAFALSRSGKGVVVRNVDPESPAAAELRRRWRQSLFSPPPEAKPN